MEAHVRLGHAAGRVISAEWVSSSGEVATIATDLNLDPAAGLGAHLDAVALVLEAIPADERTTLEAEALAHIRSA